MRTPKQYQLLDDPYSDLYRHGFHRIITEYGAVCLYLWMMSRTTGTIQQVLQELLQDEINHMTKFWGFGRWLYPSSEMKIESSTQNSKMGYFLEKDKKGVLLKINETFYRMKGVLHWRSWSWSHKIELIYTFIGVFQRMWCWNSTISTEYLEKLFALSPNSGNITIDEVEAGSAVRRRSTFDS